MSVASKAAQQPYSDRLPSDISQLCKEQYGKPAPTSDCFYCNAAVGTQMGLAWESCRVQGKRSESKGPRAQGGDGWGKKNWQAGDSGTQQRGKRVRQEMNLENKREKQLENENYIVQGK